MSDDSGEDDQVVVRGREKKRVETKKKAPIKMDESVDEAFKMLEGVSSSHALKPVAMDLGSTGPVVAFGQISSEQKLSALNMSEIHEKLGKVANVALVSTASGSEEKSFLDTVIRVVSLNQALGEISALLDAKHEQLSKMVQTIAPDASKLYRFRDAPHDAASAGLVAGNVPGSLYIETVVKKPRQTAAPVQLTDEMVAKFVPKDDDHWETLLEELAAHKSRRKPILKKTLVEVFGDKDGSSLWDKCKAEYARQHPVVQKAPVKTIELIVTPLDIDSLVGGEGAVSRSNDATAALVATSLSQKQEDKPASSRLVEEQRRVKQPLGDSDRASTDNVSKKTKDKDVAKKEKRKEAPEKDSSSKKTKEEEEKKVVSKKENRKETPEKTKDATKTNIEDDIAKFALHLKESKKRKRQEESEPTPKEEKKRTKKRGSDSESDTPVRVPTSKKPKLEHTNSTKTVPKQKKDERDRDRKEPSLDKKKQSKTLVRTNDSDDESENKKKTTQKQQKPVQQNESDSGSESDANEDPIARNLNKQFLKSPLEPPKTGKKEVDSNKSNKSNKPLAKKSSKARSPVVSESESGDESGGSMSESD